MPKITLYQFEDCPFCTRVRKKLEEKKLEYNTVEVDRNNKPKCVKDNNGLVPVIEIDGKFMGDSSRIIQFIDRNF